MERQQLVDQESPNASPLFDNSLNGVSCVTTTSCKAVGHYVSQYVNSVGTYLTLAESWNGSKWSISSTPNVSGSNDNYLSGVSCKSTTSCQAVGYYVNGSGVDQTLAESWNGSGWTLLGSPNVGAGDNELTSVSCKSATSCQAVGYDVNGSGDYQTLAESWNGSSWSLATSSDIGTSNNQLYGVSSKGRLVPGRWRLLQRLANPPGIQHPRRGVERQHLVDREQPERKPVLQQRPVQRGMPVEAVLRGGWSLREPIRELGRHLSHTGRVVERQQLVGPDHAEREQQQRQLPLWGVMHNDHVLRGRRVLRQQQRDRQTLIEKY